MTSDQFPNDTKDGKPRAVVHIITVTLDPLKSSAFADHAAEFMQTVGAELEGFIGGRVLESDDQRSVILVSFWQTRHLWAKVQWREKVGRFLAEPSELGATMVDAMCYERTVVEPRQTADPRA